MNGYYKNLPKKPMGAGALFLNECNEVLIVKPSYKEGWSIPGGCVEGNESPRLACMREVKEEIDLSIESPKLLCVDYGHDMHDGKGESLQFVFFGGVLDNSEISKIKIDNKELIEYRFVSIDIARELLSSRLAKRIPKCLGAMKASSPIYLENGEF